MGERRTQDPSDVSDALAHLDEQSPRKHNARGTELQSCACGGLVVVPDGHAADDDDADIWCKECDKPLGVKLYEAFA